MLAFAHFKTELDRRYWHDSALFNLRVYFLMLFELQLSPENEKIRTQQ